VAVDETASRRSFTVAPCPPLGDVEIVEARVVRDAELDASVDLQGDRHGEDRHAVRVVGRPVQRIDDPAAI